MFRTDAPLASRIASAILAVVIMLTPAASLAQARYGEQVFIAERPSARTPLEVWLSGEGWDEDYLSSHVCINGYRWMTKNVEHANASAADDAVPVRC